MNDTSVKFQLSQLSHRPCLLLYYTADEPDGNPTPLLAPLNSYNHIKSLDPYHPISLALNCANFHYASYSLGADIILEDVYPIGTNTSFSSEYNTPCNTTYGCCGCDNCAGSFRDISNRLDNLKLYQQWIGGPKKSRWGVPQVFGDTGFWKRMPSVEEEVVMNLLRVNHGAKGLLGWIYPTTSELENVTGELAKVITADDVAGFILGAETLNLRVIGERGEEVDVDAAGWVVGRKMLVSIVCLRYEALSGRVDVELPREVKEVERVVWGQAKWTVQEKRLAKEAGLEGLETDMVMLELD